MRQSREQVIIASAVLVLSLHAFGQTDAPVRFDPSSPAPILSQLAQDDTPPATLHLRTFDRVIAVRRLLEVKREESGWHQELAEYLLATIGEDYLGNRNALLRVWRKDGNDGTMSLLIFLYRQGHRELLSPLLSGYNGWNAAASEGLGGFYSEELEKFPREFVEALGALTPKRQLELCTAAGGTDGGGMGSGVESRVLRNLKAMGGDVALRCVRGVRTGNSEADEANRDLAPNPPKK